MNEEIRLLTARLFQIYNLKSKDKIVDAERKEKCKKTRKLKKEVTMIEKELED